MGRLKKKNKDKKVKVLESDVLKTADLPEEVEADDKLAQPSKDMLEQIIFKFPHVTDPLIGIPKQVQKELDALALKMQKRPKNNKIFDRIHLYMHGYLINIVLKKFPFIRGLQTVDVYQETLIALRFKAIPNFRDDKNMSFLNFAKMCIRRHLITLLNTSNTRKRDFSMNRAISLDSVPMNNEGNSNTYANLIADDKAAVDKTMATSEAYQITKKTLVNSLSDFEKIVLAEYLTTSSYREISSNVCHIENISKILKKKCNTKSVDNALLRIRKKAAYLLSFGRAEDLPIFVKKKN